MFVSVIIAWNLLVLAVAALVLASLRRKENNRIREVPPPPTIDVSRVDDATARKVFLELERAIADQIERSG